MTTMSQFLPSFLASLLLFLFRNRRPTMSSSLLLLLRCDCWVISANTLHDSGSTCYYTVGGGGRNEPEIREREKTRDFFLFISCLSCGLTRERRVEERRGGTYCAYIPQHALMHKRRQSRTSWPRVDAVFSFLSLSDSRRFHRRRRWLSLPLDCVHTVYNNNKPKTKKKKKKKGVTDLVDSVHYNSLLFLLRT